MLRFKISNFWISWALNFYHLKVLSHESTALRLVLTKAATESNILLLYITLKSRAPLKFKKTLIFILLAFCCCSFI